MKRKLVRGLLLAVAVFPVLFGFRLLYGFVREGAAEVPGLGAFANGLGVGGGGSSGDGFLETRKNYASFKLRSSQQAHAAPALDVDQKYEKVATLRAETRQFDDDEGKLRASIKRHEAMLQFEQARGLAGTRELRVSIGVPPAAFDSMLAEVRAIGTTTELQVDKTDKTNEYKDLAAHRASLEKARAALAALKGHGGNIDEQINLENKIMEIEDEIQKLGVRLGEFDAENEFVTIHFTLDERAPVVAPRISVAHRVSVALRWTAVTYAALLGLLFFASLTVLVLVLVAERLKWIPEALRRVDAGL